VINCERKTVANIGITNISFCLLMLKACLVPKTYKIPVIKAYSNLKNHAVRTVLCPVKHNLETGHMKHAEILKVSVTGKPRSMKHCSNRLDVTKYRS
jgi:hypothetical protein